MKKLLVDLENCYGIKKLKKTFDFTARPTYAIYAPNGIMKTSFAKTFQDLSNEEESVDAIYSDRETKRKITDETGNEIESSNVFVILSYKQEFRSEKISRLLVNSKLRKEYEEIHKNIDIKKQSLIKALRPLAGFRDRIDETLSYDFTGEHNDFYRTMMRVKIEVLDPKEPQFGEVVYNKIFSDKVVAFLENKDFRTNLANYIKKYDELLDSSTYFKKGIFNHNNAATIAKNLKDNGFFKAQHSISLNGKEKKMITNEAELEEVIQHEKDN